MEGWCSSHLFPWGQRDCLRATLNRQLDRKVDPPTACGMPVVHVATEHVATDHVVFGLSRGPVYSQRVRLTTRGPLELSSALGRLCGTSSCAQGGLLAFGTLSNQASPGE